MIEGLPKVFTNELPGLPPNKDTEFRIDLEPVMAPMHKALYHMAPTKLKEPKV